MRLNRRAWVVGLVPLAVTAANDEAILFGTVFTDSHLSLPGAKVVAHREDVPKKKYRAVTNYRGEYRIRVPAGDATYVISASAPRHVRGTRTAQVHGMDKTTANLILKLRRKADASSGKPSEE